MTLTNPVATYWNIYKIIVRHGERKFWSGPWHNGSVAANIVADLAKTYPDRQFIAVKINVLKTKDGERHVEEPVPL